MVPFEDRIVVSPEDICHALGLPIYNSRTNNNIDIPDEYRISMGPIISLGLHALKS